MTPPKKPAKKRDTMKGLNWLLCVISAAQTWASMQQISVQKMVELRPSLKEMGAKKNPPDAKPADDAQFYLSLVSKFLGKLRCRK